MIDSDYQFNFSDSQATLRILNNLLKPENFSPFSPKVLEKMGLETDLKEWEGFLKCSIIATIDSIKTHGPNFSNLGNLRWFLTQYESLKSRSQLNR